MLPSNDFHWPIARSVFLNLNVLMYTSGCLKYVSKVNRKETEKEVKLMKVRSFEELTKMIANDKSIEDEIKKILSKVLPK